MGKRGHGVQIMVFECYQGKCLLQMDMAVIHASFRVLIRVLYGWETTYSIKYCNLMVEAGMFLQSLETRRSIGMISYPEWKHSCSSHFQRRKGWASYIGKNRGVILSLGRKDRAKSITQSLLSAISLDKRPKNWNLYVGCEMPWKPRVLRKYLTP